MISAIPFAYGRTKSIDYRWLIQPPSAINERFFAETLERNSSSLSHGNRLFYISSSPPFCIFSVFFRENLLTDERGRSISFSVGCLYPFSHARDFNYFLPDMMENSDYLVDIFAATLRTGVPSDQVSSAPTIDTLKWKERAEDTSSFSPPSVRTAHTTPVRGAVIDTEARLTAPSFLAWVANEADLLRRSVDTPEVITNFTLPNSSCFISGHKPQTSDANTHAANSRADERLISPLDQLHEFVGSEKRVNPPQISSDFDKDMPSNNDCNPKSPKRGGAEKPKRAEDKSPNRGIFSIFTGWPKG